MMNLFLMILCVAIDEKFNLKYFYFYNFNYQNRICHSFFICMFVFVCVREGVCLFLCMCGYVYGFHVFANACHELTYVRYRDIQIYRYISFITAV